MAVAEEAAGTEELCEICQSKNTRGSKYVRREVHSEWPAPRKLSQIEVEAVDC